MMYRVIKAFTDLHDNDYPYAVGDIFPRSGVSVSAGRCAELAGSNNKQGQPLIVAESVEEPEKKPAKRAKKSNPEESAREAAEE